MAFNAGSRDRGWDPQTWSLILGWVWGIRVRLHLLFLLFVLFWLLEGMKSDVSFSYQATIVGFIFVSILAHEFGHCFGCRFVGGHADDILLWPLGGLAHCSPPHRPYESLITTLSGPAVNLLACVALLPVLVLSGAMSWEMWNPFTAGFAWDPAHLLSYLTLFWKVNYWLFLFNMLLPIFPFDLGRVIQELMWFRIGYYQATVIATTIGMVGGLILAAVGLFCAGRISGDYLLLSAVGAFGVIESFRTRKNLEMIGEMPENEFGYDFSQGYTSLERSMKGLQHKESSISLRSRFRAWQSRRRSLEDAKLEAELDRILGKIHEEGMDSLTRAERKVLDQASKRRRAKGGSF